MPSLFDNFSWLLAYPAIRLSNLWGPPPTYAAVPDPKVVIAVGACAVSGGPYAGHAEQLNGADAVVPVDLFIPGCPPHPLSILDGLLKFLARI